MLTSLLPGLREVRAPLAAGYLWLLAAWLLLFPRFPTPGQQWGEWFPALAKLGDVLGGVAVLAAVSFVAYLVGCLATFFTEQLVDAAVRRSNRILPLLTDLMAHIGRGLLELEVDTIHQLVRGSPAKRFPDSTHKKDPEEKTAVSLAFEGKQVTPSEQLLARLESYESRPIPARPEPETQKFLRTSAPGSPSQDEREATEARRERQRDRWQDDLPDLANYLVRSTQTVWKSLTDNRSLSRLAEASAALFNRVDRLLAESAFRVAITLPMMFVTVGLTWHSSAVPSEWLVATASTASILAVFLTWQGWNQRIEAMGILVDAIEDGTLYPPEFDQLADLGSPFLNRQGPL